MFNPHPQHHSSLHPSSPHNHIPNTVHPVVAAQSHAANHAHNTAQEAMNANPVTGAHNTHHHHTPLAAGILTLATHWLDTLAAFMALLAGKEADGTVAEGHPSQTSSNGGQSL